MTRDKSEEEVCYLQYTAVTEFSTSYETFMHLNTGLCRSDLDIINECDVGFRYDCSNEWRHVMSVPAVMGRGRGGGGGRRR